MNTLTTIAAGSAVALLTALSAVAATAGAPAGPSAGPSASPSAGTGRGEWVPPDGTIVRVTGDAANGFGIEHYDGTWLYPPTDSEAMAECGEYDTVVDRVRCRTEVRIWYRDLAKTRRAIRWARYDERH
jgi:hypothetical protein